MADDIKQGKGDTRQMDRDLVIIILIVMLLYLFFTIRSNGLVKIGKKKNASKKERKIQILKAKTEKDCPICKQGNQVTNSVKTAMPPPWGTQKGRGGRKKNIRTQGYACTNPKCRYDGITDETIHALVGDGRHGKHEKIQNLQCQACGKKFSVRKNTALYQLKSPSKIIALAVFAMTLGIDVAALAELIGICEKTLSRWLRRSGTHNRKLHNAFFTKLNLVHVQLDELWTDMRQDGKNLWLWVAMDAKTKIIPALRIGERTKDTAHRVVHELKERLAPECMPIFSSDD